ncbi:uncharacterized protein RCC_09651 [Ramularia collo-cygni]|uniref:Uncharacterized protein n=1 Tax=Ramularia collo-cygni TaxID=112498 RepID=A0A2D3V3I6_9PEZI|nr:uncharacterized protein RCC_09651 [Ramularia collo-cygni]CZT23936.1 uncharacterized protein RCC_09651 [Ramularia collo-cygni]
MEQTYSPPTRTLHTIQPAHTNEQIYLWSESSPWRPLELFLVNHQIRSETQKLISQLYKTNSMSATLDIFAKGATYTPRFTYLNLGLRPQSQLNLNVNLTILSTEHFRAHGGVTGFAFKTLLNFLSRFIFQGPTFLDHNPKFRTTGPFFIKTLNLQVAFQDDYTPATWPRTVHEIFRMVKGLSMLDTAHLYLGKVRVSADYGVDGECVHREQAWAVQPVESATLKEEDWAAVDFHFGKAWVKKYAS